MRTRFSHGVIQLILLVCLTATGCFYGFGTSMEPPKLKKSETMHEGPYLVFVHGTLLERNAPGARRDEHGHFCYDSIISDFEKKGFYVMSEIRKQRFAPDKYAMKITALVDELKSRGVPSNKINVMGLDRGARIALIASSMIKDPDVNYLLLAACPVDRSKILLRETTREFGPEYAGHFLSVRSPKDDLTGTCNGTFADSPEVSVSAEITPKTKKGRDLFYSPDPAWVDPAAQWMKHRAF